MRKMKFNRQYLTHLSEPLNVGDIIEFTDRLGMKSHLIVCIDEDKSTPCRSCPFNTDGSTVCESAVSTSFAKNGGVLSPCSALLLNDGKDYKFQHCIYYRTLDSVLEDL